MTVTVFVLRECISFTSQNWESNADELQSNTALIYVNDASFAITVIEAKLSQIIFSTPICIFPHHFDHPEALFNVYVGYNNQGRRRNFQAGKTTISLAGRRPTIATVALHYTKSMVLPVLSKATPLTMYSACIKQLVVESSECPTEVDSLFSERGVAKPNTPRCMAF